MGTNMQNIDYIYKDLSPHLSPLSKFVPTVWGHVQKHPDFSSVPTMICPHFF